MHVSPCSPAIPSWRPLTLAATLASHRGGSKCPTRGRTRPGPEPPPHHLIPLYVARKPPATQGTAITSSTPLDVWLKQELAEAQNRRRLNALAQRTEGANAKNGEQQQEQDAYQAAQQQILRDQRLQEQEERRAYQQQQSQWFANQRLRAQADVAQ